MTSSYEFLPNTPARHEVSGDQSGRDLYERRGALLAFLGQSPPVAWEDLEESVRERWRGHAAASPQPPSRQEEMAGAGPAFELTDTTVRHGWLQTGGPSGHEPIRLVLSARMNGSPRGELHQPGVFSQRLEMDGWELTSPHVLPRPWAIQAQRVLEQLYLRVNGRQHTSPAPSGRWDVSIRDLLQISAGPAVASQLPGYEAFTPTRMYVDVSTGGSGSVLLFGDGPVESDSRRFTFSVGPAGTVAFDQVDAGDQVPDWAQEPARTAARQAALLQENADQQLRGTTTSEV